jgi:serine phosphatase RsbU (regulator of sigma subunit)
MEKIGIWVNVPVFSGTSMTGELTPIGMLGTGIDISEFIADLQSDIDSNADVYIFNKSGEIMIAGDLDAAINKDKLWHTALGNEGSALYMAAREIDPINPVPYSYEKRSDGRSTIYLADYIPAVNWHLGVSYPVTIETIYANSMTGVFFIMLAVLAVIILLSNVFVRMMDKALQKYINDFTRVTADKERIATELNVATQIQTSMLPSIFPAFPDRREFDIFARMLPAKEVGGDFYDFFLIDENTLAVVMADVSGKGVPAALFMVIAKTLLKNNAQYGLSPKAVFETVNNLLCENNDADMFVTCFMGYLNIKTGEFTYVNAGHNPPLLRRKGGEFEFLKMRRGFVIAGMPDMVYRESSIMLAPGDELFMYTDGVTEAANNSDELFTEARLLAAANRYSGRPLKDFLSLIKGEIDAFADGAAQADDITMLALRIAGF